MSPNFERILFPTDFSDLAQEALPYALELTRAFDAEFHCLHVVDDAYQYWSAMGPESVPVGPPPENLLDIARERLERFREEHLSGLAKPARVHVRLGRPFAEIIGCAREEEISLIVMGTHGRGAIAHMLLGSTTEKVVRKAPCAVMTVRAAGRSFEMP
ncbi:MAG: universal stress protein [Planctomycetota bacterium]|nr:MAG: universal stress protein [Planctomycetota bacterium]